MQIDKYKYIFFQAGFLVTTILQKMLLIGSWKGSTMPEIAKRQLKHS